MEKYEEYVDKTGRIYVAVPASEYGMDLWFQSMLRSTDLSELVMIYPYVILQADQQGFLVPVNTGQSPIGKVTNMFHILYAKWLDKFRSESKPIPDQEYFEWKPTQHVPEKDTPEDRNISVGGERMIWKEEDGYALNLDKLPEVINIVYPDKNWHPNKDSRGFFMSPNQYQGYGYGGYGYGYNPYYYGGGGYIGSPSVTNPYSYTAYPWNYSSNLPRYKDGYPF